MPASKPHVTIVGAGVAGMSAALRLLQAGCPVNVIEKDDHPGGQFGAVKVGRRFHEHAFHIFADWCQNFFAICDEIGLRRPRDPEDTGAHFDPRPAFLTLEPLAKASRQGARQRERVASDFKRLEYLGSPRYFWKNANAGVAHWSDMAIYQYSVLDFLSDEVINAESKEFLNRVSVNGFMHSRGYASDIAALLHHELLLKVFAVPSYRTSARSYQTYLRHSAAYPPDSRVPYGSYPSPSFWSLRGNVDERFWGPFRKELEKIAKGSGVPWRLELGKEVTGITMDDTTKRVTHIHIGQERREAGPLLLAVPPAVLTKIIRNSPALMKALPDLLDDLASLDTMPVPALNLSFKKRFYAGYGLPMPAEHITLLDASDEFYNPDSSLARKNGIASRYGLSLVDHGSLWPELIEQGKTVLSVLAADARALMEEKDDDSIRQRIIEELQRYLDFTSADIEDYHLQSHRHEPLFVNTEGSWEYRPEARLNEGTRTFPRVQDDVANLFLAGDYCRSKVDIVSVEGAMVTGLCAAHLICGETKPPIQAREFDRDRVRWLKGRLDRWIDVVKERSDRHDAAQRRPVPEEARARRR